jgi:hypothetical protein
MYKVIMAPTKGSDSEGAIVSAGARSDAETVAVV